MDDNSNLKFNFLQEKYIPQVANFLAKQMVTKNLYYVNLKLQQEQLAQHYQKYMRKTAFKWGAALMKGNKIVTCGFSIDIMDYPQYETPIFQDKSLVSEYQRIGILIYDFLSNLTAKRGQIIIAFGVATNPQFTNSNYLTCLLAQYMLRLKLNGWKAFIGEASNPYSIKSLLKLGAKIIFEEPYTHPLMKGRIATLLKIDLGQAFSLKKIEKYVNIPSLSPRL